MKGAGADAQDAGAGGADEGAHGHVGVGRAPLLAVEAFPVGGPAGHLAQQLQVLLFLFALHARRHDGNQSGANLPLMTLTLHHKHGRSSLLRVRVRVRVRKGTQIPGSVLVKPPMYM